MIHVKIKYRAYGNTDQITVPFHMPIGLVHNQLYDLCNTYQIIEMGEFEEVDQEHINRLAKTIASAHDITDKNKNQ